MSDQATAALQDAFERINRLIESVLSGAVSRRDLLPDDFEEIWPELAARPEAEEVAHG